MSRREKSREDTNIIDIILTTAEQIIITKLSPGSRFPRQDNTIVTIRSYDETDNGCVTAVLSKNGRHLAGCRIGRYITLKDELDVYASIVNQPTDVRIVESIAIIYTETFFAFNLTENTEEEGVQQKTDYKFALYLTEPLFRFDYEARERLACRWSGVRTAIGAIGLHLSSSSSSEPEIAHVNAHGMFKRTSKSGPCVLLPIVGVSTHAPFDSMLTVIDTIWDVTTPSENEHIRKFYQFTLGRHSMYPKLSLANQIIWWKNLYEIDMYAFMQLSENDQTGGITEDELNIATATLTAQFPNMQFEENVDKTETDSEFTLIGKGGYGKIISVLITGRKNEKNIAKQVVHGACKIGGYLNIKYELERITMVRNTSTDVTDVRMRHIIRPITECIPFRLNTRFPPRGMFVMPRMIEFATPENPDDRWRIIRGIVAGVNLVHATGFTFCDLKEDNVVINEEGDAVLIDLGAAVPSDKRCVVTTQSYRPCDSGCVCVKHGGVCNDIHAISVIIKNTWKHTKSKLAVRALEIAQALHTLAATNSHAVRNKIDYWKDFPELNFMG
jgi:hypothetical protein